MKKFGNIIKKASKEPSIQVWKRLYDAATRLQKMAPWDTLRDTDLITIHLPTEEAPIFCSVLGYDRECFGIGIYVGYDALARLNRLIEVGHDPLISMDAFDQSCLVCNYGDLEDLDLQDRAIIQKLGLKFYGRNQWIYFRSTEPGCLPWFLTAPQAQLIVEVLEQLIIACEYLSCGEVEVNFKKKETLLRCYSKEEDKWIMSVASLPQPNNDWEQVRLTDELLLARLKKQPRSHGKIELDSFFLPTPIRTERDVAPYMPRVTLLADRVNDQILGKQMQEEHIYDPMIPLHLLIDYIMEHGRPAMLYIRDERMLALIGHTCSQIGVRVVEGQAMPIIDNFFISLMGFLE